MVDSSNLFERLRLHLSKTSRSLFWSGSAISQSLDNHNTDHGLKFIETYMSYNFIIKFFLKLFLTEDQAEEIDELEKLCETLSKHGLLNEDNFSKIQKHLHPRKLIQAFIELKKLGINDVDFALDFSSLYAPDKAIKGLITLKKANLLTKENAKVLENQHDPEGAALLLVKMQEAKINITETLINEIKNNLSPTYLAQLIILNTTNMPNNVADKDENKQVTKVKKGLAKITNYYDFSKNQSPPDNITPISFKKK